MTFGTLIRAALLVAGLLWCARMLPRWRADLRAWRSGDASERAALLLLWAGTGLVLLWCLRIVLSLAQSILIHASP